MITPYPGLRPFDADERGLFFGRDEECAVLIDEILAHRLTLLFAASGVGKTSLLRAGVVPRLADPEGEHLDVVMHRDWVEEPVEGLKLSIVAAMGRAGQLAEGTLGDDLLSSSLVDLVEICSVFVRPPLVLVLDQFEEFFRYQRQGATFETFLKQIGSLVANRTLPVAVVLSMREDFALELNALKPYLPGRMFESYQRLERLSLDKAEAAIVAPVEAVGFRYESRLVESLVADLAHREEGLTAGRFARRSQTVEPPYLQIVCSELWKLERDSPERVLRAATYRGKGGAAGLLGTYVERVLGGIGAREKRLISRAFDHLITRRGTKMAYTVADLAEAAGAEENALARTLEYLANAKILRAQSRAGEMWYELHHDLFSPIVAGWNRDYKAGILPKQVAKWAALLVLAAAGLWALYDLALNLTTYHLRLSVKHGVSDAVEIHRGAPRSQDLFGVRRYVEETGVDRSEIEVHRMFEVQTLEEGLESVELEVAGFLTPEAQVAALSRMGRVGEALSLAERGLSEGDPEPAKRLARQVASIDSLDAFELLQQELMEAESEQVKSEIVAALGQMPLEQVLASLELELEGATAGLKSKIARALGVVGLEKGVELLRVLAQDESGEVRFNATMALGRLASTEYVEQLLVERMSDSDKKVSRAAMRALGEVGSARAVEPLIESLSDTEEETRNVAVLALGGVGGGEASAHLIEVISAPESVMVRGNAALMLGRLRHPGAEKALIDKLADLEPWVRSRAASALGSLGSVEAVTPLINKLSDSDRDVRRKAAFALIRLDYHDVEPLLMKKISDAKASVRSAAAIALGGLGSEQSVGPLMEGLSDADPDVRSSAATALGRLGSLKAVAYLIRTLSDPVGDVSASAAEALGNLGSAEAEEELIRSLSGGAVGSSAAAALGLLGSVKAIEPLIDGLGNPDENVRLRAAESLALLGSAGAVGPLIERISDPRWQVRLFAAESLGRMGSLQAVEPVIERLSDEDWDVRASAARALGRLGSTAVVKTLLASLSDTYPVVRAGAAEALGRVGGSEEVQPLLRRLSDRSGTVRSSAATALGRLRGADAVEPLIERLSDEDETVRSSAALALGHLRSTRAVGPLTKCLNDHRPEVRRAAALALGAVADTRASDPNSQLYEEEEHRPRLRIAAAAALLGLGAGGERLKEAADSPLSRDRREVAEALGEIGAEAGLPILEGLLKDPVVGVRNSAVEAMKKIASPTSVPALRTVVLKSPADATGPAQRAADALHAIKTPEAVDALLEALAINEDILGFRAYRYLVDLGASHAIPQLEARLSRLKDEHEAWRELRDRDSTDLSPDDERRLLEESPETLWGWDIAYAIARFDTEKGIELLRDDLKDIRQGAAHGLGSAGTIDLILRLDRERAEDSSFPFRVSAFRAIDLSLRHLERTAGAEEREALLALLDRVEDRAAVCTRVEWTIQMLDREKPFQSGACENLLRREKKG